MRQTIVKFFEKYYNTKTVVFAIFFMFFQTKLLNLVIPSYVSFYTENYLNYLYAFALGAVLINEFRIFTKAKEFIILIGFLVWMLVLGLAHYSFNMSTTLNIVFGTLIAFSVPFILSDNMKRKFTTVLVAPVFLFLLIFSGLGIYAFVLNADLRPLTTYMLPIDIWCSRLAIFFHPNYTSAVYSVFFIIGLIVFFYFKKLYQRIAIGLILIIFYITITLTQTRTSYISFSFIIGLIIACYVFKKNATKSLIKRYFITITTLIAITLVVFLLFTPVLNLFNSIRISLSNYDFSSYPLVMSIEEKEKYGTLDYGDVVQPSVSENDNQIENNLSVGRHYQDISHFNGRTAIWSDYLEIIKTYPLTLLTGYRLDSWDITVEVENLTGNWQNNNMHNGYLYILLAFGIPGLIMYLAFFILVLLRIVGMILKDKQLNHELLIYAGVVVCFMMTELMEMFITSVNYILPVMLFYCCGMICSSSKEYRIRLRDFVDKTA